MHESPIIEREIDDDEPCCRQAFVEALARRHVARCDQRNREIVKARIMADEQQ